MMNKLLKAGALLVLIGLFMGTGERTYAQNPVDHNAKGKAAETAPVVISGTINFDTSYTLYIQPLGLDMAYDQTVSEIEISEDGKFHWSKTIEKPQWFQGVFLRKKRDEQLGATFPLYLRPGQQLNFELHYSDSTYLTVISAETDPENRALIEYSGFLNRKKRALFFDPSNNQTLLSIAQSYLDEANALLVRNPVENPVVRRYLTIWSYNEYLGVLFNRSGSLLSAESLSSLPLIDALNDEMILSFYSGKSNIDQYVDLQLGDVEREDRIGRLEKKIDYLKQNFSNERIIDAVINRNLENFVTRYVIRSADQFAEDGRRLEALTAQLTDTGRREQIMENFNNLSFTQVGSAIPPAIFKDANGTDVRLQDLQGKYIYIDLWASWCVPCIKEIPYLHELEKLYSDKNIVFVSISIDESKKAWRDKMAELNLPGHQWELGESNYDQYMNVTGIPHFILYGPDGRLLQYKAPRPSAPGIRALLDSLLENTKR